MNSKQELERGPDGLVLRISGLIDEHIKFNAVMTRIAGELKPGETLLIDLQGLLRMNSAGLREWLLFLESLQKTYALKFQAINEHCVLQASMIPIILGKPGTPVLAFECPYRCEKCKERSTKLVSASAAAVRGGQFQAPQEMCAKCKVPLEFDSLTAEYFAFLKHSGA